MTTHKQKLILPIIILFMILGIYQNVSAQNPETIFNVICWEPLRIPDIDKDYVRFHLGYWSTGGEYFRTLIVTQSGFASWGSLYHDTYSDWTTINGSVDDIVLSVYIEDAQDPTSHEAVPVTLTFTNDYDTQEIVLRIDQLEKCVETYAPGPYVPVFINVSNRQTLGQDTSQAQSQVPQASAINSATGTRYYFTPRSDGVVPIPPPYTENKLSQ